MASTKIRITVKENSVIGDIDVSLSDFSQIIDTVRKLFNYAADEALGKQHQCGFMISSIRRNSPTVMEITPQSSKFANSGKIIAEQLIAQHKSLLSDNEIDNRNLSNEYLNNISELNKKSNISIKMEAISDSGSRAPIMETGQPTTDAIKKIQEKETTCKTSVVGRLEQLNLHSTNKYVYVYPRISQWSAVKVLFQNSHKKDIIKCVDQIVEVGGMGHYDLHSFRPYMIEMESIERLGDVPLDFSKFRGKFSSITGGKSVDESMRELRDEEE